MCYGLATKLEQTKASIFSFSMKLDFKKKKGIIKIVFAAFPDVLPPMNKSASMYPTKGRVQIQMCSPNSILPD